MQIGADSFVGEDVLDSLLYDEGEADTDGGEYPEHDGSIGHGATEPQVYRGSGEETSVPGEFEGGGVGVHLQWGCGFKRICKGPRVSKMVGVFLALL